MTHPPRPATISIADFTPIPAAAREGFTRLKAEVTATAATFMGPVAPAVSRDRALKALMRAEALCREIRRELRAANPRVKA